VFVAEKDSDLQSRAFALMSLAEIGAPECEAPIRKILDRKSHRLKGWAGLAAGVSGNQALAPYVRTAYFRKGTDPSIRAAMAIGLGLLSDRTVAKSLAHTARDVGADPDFRGYAITALALMGDRDSEDLITDVLTTKGNPSLHRNAALALGLIGRPGSGKRIVSIMNDTNDLYVKAAATIALGYLREPTSAQALAKAAVDPDSPYLARLYAVLAIGYLGDRSAAPPKLSRLAWHFNYRVSIPAVDWLTSLL
jgi:HEAT repeat protein